MKHKLLVIDSGIGGLTTLTNLVKKLPSFEFLYLADDSFLPYGNKTHQEIFWHIDQLIAKKEDQVDGVVLACNTATGVAVEGLRRLYSFPIVGTEPAIVPASSNNQTALCLVTPLEAAQAKLKRLVGNRRVVVLPQPDLAKIIDNELMDGKGIKELTDSRLLVEITSKIKEQATQYETKNIVLGCTHYVYLKYTSLLDGFHLFDGNEGVANRAVALFEKPYHECNPKEERTCDESPNDLLCRVQFEFSSGNKKKSLTAQRLFMQLLRR